MPDINLLVKRFPNPGMIMQVIAYLLELFPPDQDLIPDYHRLWMLQQWAAAVGATILPQHVKFVKHGVRKP